MAKKRTVPSEIRPYVLGYLALLEHQGVPIQSAYIFGSWAKGSPHQWSDIDICVISPAFSSWQKKTRALIKASYDDFTMIEAHGFSPKEFQPNSNPLANEIFQHGIRVQ